MDADLKLTYGSPRWTGELLDCSMPMTFDTYNKCSYDCLYCFSYFQKSHSLGKKDEETRAVKGDYHTQIELTSVNPKKTIDLFEGKTNLSFNAYIKQKKVMQWGGLADQFDNNEKRQGVTLALLKYFKSINYPLCFSTKATWWLDDSRYTDLVKGQDNWNCKFSIINLDKGRASKMEQGVESPMKRIEAIKKYSSLNKGGATLRLRPFIIGFSDRNDEYLELIKLAHEAGATAVSTEFFCLETRADANLKERYRRMSEICGFDVYDFYKKNSVGAGYRRLNYDIKIPYVNKMQELCKKLGMRFYVSDAHLKERCANGSCCGLSPEWNYSRGQFTEAIVIARRKGEVRFSDIEKDMQMYKDIPYGSDGFNTSTSQNRVKRRKQSMYDYIREKWNTPNAGTSPYKYFSGMLEPIGLDKEKNVIYRFNKEKFDASKLK